MIKNIHQTHFISIRKRMQADGNAWKTTKDSTYTGEKVQLSNKGQIALSVLGSKKSLCVLWTHTVFWPQINVHPKDKKDIKRISTDIKGYQKSTFVSHSFAFISGKVWQSHYIYTHNSAFIGNLVFLWNWKTRFTHKLILISTNLTAVSLYLKK